MEEEKSLKFPAKLWALINTPSEVIKWNPNGTSILLDLEYLEHHLKSSNSLFKLKRIASFINQLELHGFEKLSTNEYRHGFFQENRSELLSQIVPRPSDPCRRIVPTNSLMNKARLNLRNELVFRRIGKILKDYVPIVDVPEEYFDNPAEIVPNYLQHEGFPGFFGNHVTNDQLKKFFSETEIVEPTISSEPPERLLEQSNEFLLPYETIQIDESSSDGIECMDVSESVECEDGPRDDQSSDAFSNLFSQIRESINVLNE